MTAPIRRMTPPELFLSALAPAAAYMPLSIFTHAGCADEGLGDPCVGREGRPAGPDSFRCGIEVVAPGLTQRHRDGVLPSRGRLPPQAHAEQASGNG